MRIVQHLKTLLLITLLAFTASGVVSAKVASGLQNLSPGLHQGEVAFNLLMHQGKTQSSYDDASGSSVVTKGVTNSVPGTVARVVPDTPITRASGTLGKPGAKDVFVTGADDIRGLNAKQIAERLTIPQSPTGFRVTEFPTPKSGIASPINRAEPGFIGGGRTAGGAREFVIPNGSTPTGSTTRVVR